MDFSYWKHLRFSGLQLNSLICTCVALAVVALIFRAVYLPTFSSLGVVGLNDLFAVNSHASTLNSNSANAKSKFLEVPQIIWGLNNQKIAFARAVLTARMLNRTLLLPSLSASLFYKEVDRLKPISFDKVFQFDKFNSLCEGFVRLSRYSEISNRSNIIELQKGSGRRWSMERDLDQLREFSKHPYDGYETIRVVGKHPFLWHDHWPVKDYAKVFECLVLAEEISKEADKVVSRIREVGLKEINNVSSSQSSVNSLLQTEVRYVAVHMRIEKDWMIHCKKREQRMNISDICSSKQQIMERVGDIVGLKAPVVVYLAIADDLLGDTSLLSGWKEGFLAFEKKKLGVFDIYKKHPYLIQSAIDFEVCLRSDVFVGNSFSTFSSLVVLDRTQKILSMGVAELCGTDVRWPSYAYNLEGELKGPRLWVANMSDVSLQVISYGSNHISCR